MDILAGVLSDKLLKGLLSTIWKDIKYQMNPCSYAKKWENVNESLKNRFHDIEWELQSQLRGIGKIPKEEVAYWLEQVNRRIETDEDLTKKGGCFCNTSCAARRIDKRAQKLKMLLAEGEKYIQAGVILVREDLSMTVDYLMSQIQKMAGELGRQKEEVESTLQGQLRFGKIVEGEVKSWLQEVEKKLETAQDVTSRSLPLEDTAELLEEKIGELRELCGNGKKHIHDGAILVQDDPSFIKGIPLPSEKCYGREAELEQIQECLKGDKLTRIAVCGMGGVGKTTMMKQVHNAFLKESTFDKVIWVAVSDRLNIFNVQDEIAEQLTGDPLEVEDSTQRAAKLTRMLERGRTLLILDDVWEAFSADEVGFPANFGDNCSKLVLTTRSMDVARMMECQSIIKLEPLSPDNAWQLFLDVGHDSSDPIQMWKFSYDNLKDKKLQHCLLYCALYPKGFEIPKKELIECWIEEGYIDQVDTRYEMTCEGHEILRTLQDEGLLECSESEGDQNAAEIHQILGVDSGRSCGSVKMHDDFRLLALNSMDKITRFFVEAGLSEEALQTKEAWAEEVEKVSLMRNGMQEIPLAKPHLKNYNMLTTLLMPNNRIETIPDSFFMQTPELKILDLSWNRALKSLPESTSNLENLTTLLLQSCESLRKVPSLLKCRRLTKLDLSWAGIEEVPGGMEMLADLKYLDLRAPRLGKIPQGLLPKLISLQYLLVMEMEAEEVVTLSKLEYLQGTAGSSDEMAVLLEFMQNQVKQIASHSFKVEDPSLALFLDTDMEGKLVVFLKDKFILGDLYTVVGRDGDRDLGCVNSGLANDTLRLQVLCIQALENIECVFCSAFNPLQTLTTLLLVELDSLTSVFDENGLGLSASPPASYSAFPLNSIIIKDCPALKKLFPSAVLLGYLQNLQHIEVVDCKELEEIIASTSEEEAQEKLILPQIKTLKLNDLPALKSICSTNSVLICDSLETLEIIYCEELKRIPLYLPQLGDAQTPAPLALKTITADSEEWWKASEWCHPNARDILLPKCVFSSDGYDEALEELNLPNLKTLELNDLPAWKGIRSSSKVLSSGSLEILEITDCRKLKRKSSLVSSPT